MLTGKMELGREKPVPRPILQHSFHKDRTGIEFRLPRLEVKNSFLSHGRVPHLLKSLMCNTGIPELTQIRATRLHANAILYYY
jgi:hypothetical protein